MTSLAWFNSLSRIPPAAGQKLLVLPCASDTPSAGPVHLVMHQCCTPNTTLIDQPHRPGWDYGHVGAVLGAQWRHGVGRHQPSVEAATDREQS